MSLMGMKEVIITEKEADSISCDIDTVRPEYIEKLKTIDNEGKFISFMSIDELRNAIEGRNFSR
jgi:hypothetical protein